MFHIHNSAKMLSVKTTLVFSFNFHHINTFMSININITDHKCICFGVSNTGVNLFKMH